MTERPIIFSGPMIRAILEGRKTVTRRVVKPQPQLAIMERKGTDALRAAREIGIVPDGDQPKWRWRGTFAMPWPSAIVRRCPYGACGDKLWVRETGWERPERTRRMMLEGADTWEPYYYDADGLDKQDHEQFQSWGFRRRPDIFMPRLASRITLEIVSVHVEQLQCIERDDCIAEGIDPDDFPPPPDDDEYEFNYRAGFRRLWDSINAKKAPWSDNPWVWVIHFKRI